MRTVLLLVSKDFRRKWKNPVVIIGFMLIPVVFTFILGMVFGGSEEEILPKVQVLAADNDQSLLSQMFLNSLSQGDLEKLIEIRKVEEKEGRRLLDRGKASALLIIPASFGKDVWEGRPVELLLLKNPSEQFLPQIAEEVIDTASLLFSSLFSVFSDELAAIKGFLERESLSDEDISSLSIMIKNRIEGIAKFVLPPVISLKQETISRARKQATNVSIHHYIFPALAVMFLLFICNVVFEDMLREKESGTLLRLSVSPLKFTEFIWSKTVTSALIGIFCTIFLILLGSLIFSIRWGNPVLVLFIVLSLNILIAGFISFLYSFIRTERQAGAVLSSVILIMSLVGGSMIPVENFPSFLKPVSRLTLNYWGLEAFRISILGEPVRQIIPILAGMVLAGILLSFLSSRFLERNLRKGLLR